MKRKRLIMTTMVLTIILSFLPLEAYAVKEYANTSDPTVVKAYMTSLRRCYDAGAFLPNLGNDLNAMTLRSAISNSVKVALPTGSTDESDSEVGCQSLLYGEGFGWTSGLFALFKPGDTDIASRAAGLGYEVESVEGASTYDDCVKFTYDYTLNTYSTGAIVGDSSETTTKPVYSDLICANLDGDTITSLAIETEEHSDYSAGEFPVSLDIVRKKVHGVKTNVVRLKGVSSLGATHSTNGTAPYTEYGEGDSWASLKTDVLSIVANFFDRIVKNSEGFSTTFAWNDRTLKTPENMGSTEYVIKDPSVAANTAVGYFSGTYSDAASLEIDNKQLLTYDLQLLQQHYYDGKDTSSYWVCDQDWSVYPKFSKSIVMSPQGQKGDCRVNVDDSTAGKSKKINGFTSAGDDKYQFDAAGWTKLNLEGLIDQINNLAKSLSDEELSAIIGASGSSSIRPEESSGDEMNCSGAGGIGWIVCPILKWLKGGVQDIYEDYVEPNLALQPRLFSNNVEGGTDITFNTWQIFQGFANVCFIILLLVVIFSQLTGVGIDNYGIKKILPKMMVAAILINLSYLICEICVDLSNIIGTSVRELFDGLVSSPSTVTTGSGENTIVSVGIFVALISIAGVIENSATLLTLFISAIGLLISIFFLFVLLSVRQAVVIVLMVISPLAFVMYMLPNTKKIFDKWLKFFQGLLLVYPICGLLVGGGNFVSNLLLQANSNGSLTTGGEGVGAYLWTFTAMIVGIAPIFFLPMVLKGSFAAMGKVGGMITGLGTKASGVATKRLTDSGINKNLQQAGLERQTRIRAGLDRNGNNTSRFRRVVGSVMSGGRRSRQRNALQYQKMLSDRGSLEATEGEDFMLATQTSNIRKELEASGDINNTTVLQNGLQTALQSNDRARIRAYTDALSEKGDSGRDAVKAAWNSAVASPGGVSNEAARTFGDNVMSKHAATYKADARSLFETARHAQDGNIHETNNGMQVPSGSLAMNAKSSTMVSMDDGEFAQTFDDGADGRTWQDRVRQQAIDDAARSARTDYLRTHVGDTVGADAAEVAARTRASGDGTGENAIRAVQRNAWKAIQDDPNMKSERYNRLRNVAQGFSPDNDDWLQVHVNP